MVENISAFYQAIVQDNGMAVIIIVFIGLMTAKEFLLVKGKFKTGMTYLNIFIIGTAVVFFVRFGYTVMGILAQTP